MLYSYRDVWNIYCTEARGRNLLVAASWSEKRAAKLYTDGEAINVRLLASFLVTMVDNFPLFEFPCDSACMHAAKLMHKFHHDIMHSVY